MKPMTDASRPPAPARTAPSDSCSNPFRGNKRHSLPSWPSGTPLERLIQPPPAKGINGRTRAATCTAAASLVTIPGQNTMIEAMTDGRVYLRLKAPRRSDVVSTPAYRRSRPCAPRIYNRISGAGTSAAVCDTTSMNGPAKETAKNRDPIQPS